MTPEEIIQQCQAVLDRPDTDWDALYLRLRCSPLSSDFPRERFVRTPISTLVRSLEYIDNEEKRQHNIAASTTAKLCLQMISIAHGMAGSKIPASSLNLKDFLPFPDWQPPNQPTKVGPSEVTKEVLFDLIKHNRIPMGVYLYLVNPPEASR